MREEAPGDHPSSISGLLAVMDRLAGRLPPEQASLAEFLVTYRRTTVAVDEALRAGFFEDPEWVEQWDIAFAAFYLEALREHLVAAGTPSRPWQLAFAAPPGLPPLLSVLLGMNAHINYDLPQAILAVVTDAQFRDSALMARRLRDHERIDTILAGRVAAEDVQISSRSTRRPIDRTLRPVNRWASKRFLREAREKVWGNTLELWHARTIGEDDYRTRLTELEVLTAAKVTDLLTPGPVLLRLAVSGFGVTLPPRG